MEKNKNIPKIRFKGYNDEWEKKELGTFGNVKSCKRIYKEQTLDFGDIPFYKIGTFGSKADAFINYETYVHFRNNYAYPNIGDILISASGSLGRTVEYDGEKAYYQDSNIVWLNIESNSLINKFLKHLYNYITWDTVEGSTIKRIYNKDILNKNVKIPSVEEQAKIANLFDLLDEKLEIQREKHEKLVNFKKAMLENVFPKEGEKRPKIRFDGYNDDWVKGVLKDYINSEQKGTTQFSQLKHGKNKYLDADALNGTSLIYCDKESDVKETDVLILWDGSKAGTVYTGFEGVLGSTLKSFKLKADVNNYFIYSYLKYKEHNIFNFYRTPNIPHVINNFTDIFEISIPSINKQKLIGSFFKNLDEKIQVSEEKITKIENFKKAMMDGLFI